MFDVFYLNEPFIIYYPLLKFKDPINLVGLLLVNYPFPIVLICVGCFDYYLYY